MFLIYQSLIFIHDSVNISVSFVMVCQAIPHDSKKKKQRKLYLYRPIMEPRTSAIEYHLECLLTLAK